MNDVYKAPLFTFWPTPLSAKDLKECFDVKTKNSKRKVKEKVKESSFFQFLNWFPLSY